MQNLSIRDITLYPRGSYGKGPTDSGALDIAPGQTFTDDTGRAFDGPARVTLWLWDSGRYVGQVETHGGDEFARIAGDYAGGAA